MEYDAKYHKGVHSNIIFDSELYKLKGLVYFRKNLKNIKCLDKKTIVEYGCGMGQNIYPIRKLTAWGYDISNYALNFCKNLGINIISDKKIIPASDIVLCNHVLEHLECPLEHLKFIKSKLKKDGIIVLVLPKEKHEKTNLKPDKINYHLYSWNFRTINNLLDVAGFKVIDNSEFGEVGYNRLRFLAKINFEVYFQMIKFLGFFVDKKEIRVIATPKND